MKREEMNQLAEDAMKAWRSGAIVPALSQFYSRNNDGTFCGCMMTAAAVTRDPSVLESLQRGLVIPTREIESLCGTTGMKSRLLTEGFDHRYPAIPNEPLCRLANQVRRAVFVIDDEGYAMRAKTVEELKDVPTPQLENEEGKG